jgi:uncharacterized protein (TIGR03790 family)
MQSVLTPIASTLRVSRAIARRFRLHAHGRAPALRALAGFLVFTSSIGNKCAEAQSAANVLLVVNSASAASDTIGKYYAAHRGVPQDNVCTITTETTESISRDLYVRQIEEPIWACIASRRAHDRILYIVLTKDVPIRIRGTGGRTGTNASVDSELTVLYRRHTGAEAPIAGFIPNPYFAGTAAIATIKPFSHAWQDIYLVTRLDGYTVQDAIGLIDRAAAPVRDGRFVLDGRASLLDSGGDRWLRTAADRLRELGLSDHVELDESTRVLTKEPRVLGYYSWGSNDPAIRLRHFDMQFLPGALAGMFVSTDGRTFKEPPPTWTPSDDPRNGVFGGSHQSLMADLIREGVTGAAGHVDEPYLDATIRPDILFPAYASGRNLAESYYAAMPYLSWQTIVVGDPLCAPFPHVALDAHDIDAGIDAPTELPAYFARRRLAHVGMGLNGAAMANYVRAESRAGRKDDAGAREALEAAVAADPKFTTARFDLASRYESDKMFEQAAAQYRAILSYTPNDGVALNNLAFDLAVHLNRPEEALPLAERACTIVKNSFAFLDTLAWTQHLVKHDADAVVTMRLLRSGGMVNADMLWHSAVIFATANDFTRATSELNLALKMKPELADQDDVKALRQRLSAAK